MSAPINLAFSGDQHEHLKSFLFPGDGNEAVATCLGIYCFASWLIGCRPTGSVT
jgi:hypothetical protein